MKTEKHTRKEIIDHNLQAAGWNVSDRSQVIEEFDIEVGLPEGVSEPLTPYQGHQFSDYVLLGKDAKPLAVVEAKKSSKDAAIGREQAKQYCFNIHKQMGGELPFCFYTNGLETYFWDLDNYPPRKVVGFPTRDDLERFQYIRRNRKPLTQELINTNIAGRDYQIRAIRTVLEAIEQKKRRFPTRNGYRYSSPRNKEIMRVFRDLEIVEQLGSGVPRILEKYGREAFEIRPNFVRVIFHYDKSFARQTPETSSSRAQSRAQSGAQSGAQSSILSALVNAPLSASELTATLGLETKTGAFKRAIQELLQKQLIEYTLPEKPNTRSILFAHRELREMSKEDRTRACYLHACLRYVQRDFMTNTTLRERFGIEDKNSATASRIIKETSTAGLIRCYDETVGSKAKKIPAVVGLTITRYLFDGCLMIKGIHRAHISLNWQTSDS